MGDIALYQDYGSDRYSHAALMGINGNSLHGAIYNEELGSTAVYQCPYKNMADSRDHVTFMRPAFETLLRSTTEVPRKQTIGNFMYFNLYQTYAEFTGCAPDKKSVDIPAEIEGLPVCSIGATAISDPWTQTVYIPATVSMLGAAPSYCSTNLKTVTIDADNPYMQVIGRAIYSKDGETLLCCLPNNSGTFVIPDHVKYIADFAFSACNRVTSITIPEGVQTIGKAAFGGCAALTKIALPASVKSIGAKAFFGCTALTEISMQNQLKEIGNKAFSNCPKLSRVVIPGSVTAIGSELFLDSQTVLCAYRGTYAATYAAENKLAFEQVPDVGNPFEDVIHGTFYHDAVVWAVEHDITTGVSATRFAPNAACTRAQVVTFLWRAAGCPEPAAQTQPFSDVKRGIYCEKAVRWAVQNGITSGTDKTHFSPDGTASRAEFVTFLWRYGKCPAAATQTDFSDIKNQGAYCYRAVQWAAAAGITTGTGSGRFSPDTVCSRGQVVTFLLRNASTQTD